MLWWWAALGQANAAALHTCGELPTSGCYATIGEAIDAAVDGDIVYVAPGAYEEGLKFDKAITLMGEPGNILLDPGDPGIDSVIAVGGPGRITLQDLRIVTASARPISIRDGDVLIQGCTLRSNGLQYEGGLVRAEGSAVDLEDTRFEAATAVFGGQIFLEDSTVAVSSSTFRGGFAVAAGGAIAAMGEAETSSLVLLTSSFTGGSAAESGGAVHLDQAAAFVSASRFEGNEADDGGAIGAIGDAGLTIEATDFVSNSARRAGAAVRSAVETRISTSTFVSNEAVEGGAVWASAPRSIVSNRFCGNASARQGSAIAGTIGAAAGTLAITNNVFAANVAEAADPDQAGAVAFLTGEAAPVATLRVAHNTFLENAGAIASAIDLGAAPALAAQITGNLVAGNTVTGGSDGHGWAVVLGGPAHLVTHNLWWSNPGGGHVLEGYDTDGVAGDPQLVRWSSALCATFAGGGADPVWPAWNGVGRDAGPPESSDPDGTRADIGAHGGPDADEAAWADSDGDGYPAVYDCLPDDASAHPERYDEPYDGVDRDCDFWSDFDADQDGWTRDVDCLDTDPAISPGAVEIPYDTVDQDCAGGDSNDLDGDGWPKGEGQDCDDEDASVNPGQARDSWDLDRNCDGLVTALEPGCASAPGGSLAAMLAFVALLARRRAAALVGLALVFAAPARAETCAPLAESEFRTLVLDSQSAIDRDDATLHEQIVEEVRQRIPCLVFLPSERLWADFLVGVAIVEFSRGRDWQTPLAAALRVRPTVDRGVGSGHPMAHWEPDPVADPPGGAVPPGEALYVDGRPATALPPARGLYLVQREREGIYLSRLVVDEPVPADWLALPIRVPIELAPWATGSLRIGPVAERQSTGWDSAYVPNDLWGRLLPGADLRAGATYGRLSGQVGYTISLRGPGDLSAQRAHVELRAASGAWSVGGGFGATDAGVFEGVEADVRRRDVSLPWVYGVLERRRGEPTRFDGAFRAGFGRAVARAEYRAGWMANGQSRLRYGFEVGAQYAVFHQTRAPAENLVGAATCYAVFDLGFAGGKGW